MGVYYIMIIIKISKKRILIGQIFHFHCCQIILWWNDMEAFDRAWFGCCPSRRIPSDDNWIPTCSSNDVNVTCNAIGLTQATGRWKQMRTHAQNGENACLIKSPEHRQVHEMLDFYSHSMRVPWFGHFCSTETRFVDVMTPVFMIRWPCQNRPLAKMDVRWYEPVKIHHGTCVHQQTILWIQGTKWVPWCNGPYHWMCFKC